jgi:hypothetical protein
MSPTKPIRIVVIAQPQKLLMCSCGDGSIELPQISVEAGSRIAYELAEYLRREWNLAAICLFSPVMNSSQRSSVLAVVGRVPEAPRGYIWSEASEAIRSVVPGPQAELLRISLQQVAEYESGKRPGPFARAKWLEELATWAAPALAERGLSWTGAFQQFGGGPGSALMRLETNGPAVWFKSVCGSLTREYAISKYIAAHTPGILPDILATRDDWRAWLMLEAEGCSLANSYSAEAWSGAGRELGAVQRAHVGATEDLLALGALDYCGPAVVNSVEALCRRLPELMSRQPANSRAPRLSRKQMRVMGSHSPVLCEALFHSNIPTTLVHGDPNPHNFIVGPTDTKIIDWAESYVSHPFLSYEYLRMHLHRTHPQEATEWEKELRESYARAWRPIVDERDIEDTFSLVPVIAPLIVASRALDRLDGPPEDQHGEIPATEAFIRSLARAAFRALHPLEEVAA